VLRSVCCAAKEILLIFLGFLIPLAIYLLILALLNRSQHPVLVPGSWDCAGVLLASSGLLLLGGPAILTGFYEDWRLTWLLGQTRFLRGFGDSWPFWISVWIAYFLLIAGGAAWLLASRRRFTSIYNLEPAVLEDGISQVLDRLGLEWTRAGSDQILIRPRELVETEPLEAAGFKGHSGNRAAYRHGQRPSSPATAQGSAHAHSPITLTLAPFVALRHVTLRWSGPWRAVRSEVETELCQFFRSVYSNENPASRWFLSIAVSLFLVCFFALAGLVAVQLIRLFR
jgi:hypothetical protein